MNSKRNLLGILLALVAGLFCIAPAAQAQESESDLSAIREMWEGQPLTVKISGNRAAGLADFARTFARAYPSDLTDAIVARLDDPKNTRKDPNTFIFDAPHGYLKYRYAMDGGAWLELCYWTLPKGHRMVAVSMVDLYSSDKEGLLAFYDYDPMTHRMNPITPLPIRRGLERGIDGRIVELPRVGYDIRLYEPSDRRAKPEVLKWVKGTQFFESDR